MVPEPLRPFLYHINTHCCILPTSAEIHSTKIIFSFSSLHVVFDFFYKDNDKKGKNLYVFVLNKAKRGQSHTRF